MYLYWFERIVRRASGNYGWALPYWAWDSASERTLPTMFQNGTSLSQLYTVNRDPNINNGSASLPAGDVSYASDFSTTVFSTPSQTGANDTFQDTPHGAVHVDVGGASGWMTSILTSAQDPIFYLHHANCDRLWQVWRANYGGSDPVNDATWTGKTYTFFNENGAAVTMTACQIINAAQQLNYVYQNGPTLSQETCPSPAKPPCHIRILPFPLQFAKIPPLGDQTVPISVPLSADARGQLLKLAESRSEAVYLQLSGVETAHQPGVVWGTYVGPAPVERAETNRANHPALVGNVVLFGTGIRSVMPRMFRPAVFSFRLSKTVLASLKDSDKLVITFDAHGPLLKGELSHPKVQSAVQIAKISIIIETLCF
jgi:hypothetical protein